MSTPKSDFYFSDPGIGIKVGKGYVSIKADGTIEYGEGYTPDEAARAFWNAVGRRRKTDDAADDMLAALQGILACDDKHALVPYDYMHGDADVKLAMDQARAAIAKATLDQTAGA